MSSHNGPLASLTQASTFYTDTWTQSIDKRFIELLRIEKEGGRFDYTRKNAVTIRRVLKILNDEFKKNFEFNFCVDRVNKLQRCYKIFYYISKYKGITYNLVTGKIECDAEMWQHICKSKRLAMAYASQGEMEYESLRIIFKQDDDSVGWHRLDDIEQISSNFSDLSVPNTIRFPRKILQVSSDSDFWRYIVGNGFGTSSVGASTSYHTPSWSNNTKVNSAHDDEVVKPFNPQSASPSKNTPKKPKV